MKKISIITVCYNAEKEIEQTIKSVINQSYTNIEYIIIDGKSKDDTVRIIEKYKKNIDIFVSEPDAGIYDAFNKGVKKATGEVIHILNAGDYYFDNNVIEKVMKEFNEKELDYVHAILKTIDPITNYSEYYHFPLNISIEEAMLKKCCPPHPSFFVKKECFEKYGYFDESYKISADLELMFNCLLHSQNGIFVAIVTTVFVKDGISSNPNYDQLRLIEVNKIIEKVLNLNYSLESSFSNEKNTGDLLKIWGKYALKNVKGITSIINDKPLKIIIFGTKDIGQMLYFDCLKSGHEVVSFIDNNFKYENDCFGIQVNSTEWLLNNQDLYDICLISIEGMHSKELRADISKKLPNKKVYSWRDLISLILKEN